MKIVFYFKYMYWIFLFLQYCDIDYDSKRYYQSMTSFFMEKQSNTDQMQR